MELLIFLFLPLLFGLGGGDDSEVAGEDRVGTDDNDTIETGEGDDHIDALAGNDEVNGGGGDDTILGRTGSDFLEGGAGDDLIDAGALGASDYVYGDSGDDTLIGGGGNDLLVGGEGNDLVDLGAGDDWNWVDDETNPQDFAVGQLGDDTVLGGAGNDDIFDYDGQNSLDGGAGNDFVDGTDRDGQGDARPDVVRGGDGNDLVYGDDGDSLYGGAGSDVFGAQTYLGDDQVTTVHDFNGSEDLLQINVDQAVADLTTTAVTMQTIGGDVVLLSNGVELVRLIAPTSFDLSAVQWYQNEIRVTPLAA